MAMLEVAQHGRTTDPSIAAIFKARQINAQIGGPMIAPWEVAELPQEWLDAFDAIATDLTKTQAGLKEFNDFVAAWRQNAAKANKRH